MSTDFFCLPHSSPTRTSAALGGTIIPLYTYPTDPTWATVARVKIAHPRVPVIAIANPDSGPGRSRDINYVDGIRKLMTEGILVIGYVATGYGTVPLTHILRQIDQYRCWYNINGILFDEMSNLPGHVDYYKSLSNYAKSLGLTYTVGNPGTDTTPSYVDTVDTILIYENSWLPDIKTLGGWHLRYSRNHWGITIYGEIQLDEQYVYSAKQYVGYLYITDSALPNPYSSLPSYYDILVASLDQNANSMHIGRNATRTDYQKFA